MSLNDRLTAALRVMIEMDRRLLASVTKSCEPEQVAFISNNPTAKTMTLSVVNRVLSKAATMPASDNQEYLEGREKLLAKCAELRQLLQGGAS